MAQMTAAGAGRAAPSMRVTPLIVGGALASAAVLVRANDPANAGTWWPGCAFRQVTGLWCPACGLTRGTHQLLNGHIGAALDHNAFTPVVLLAIVVTWVAWTRRSFGRAPTGLAVTLGSLRDRTWRWLGPTLLTVAASYGVLRNLPVAPLQSLAP